MILSKLKKELPESGLYIILLLIFFTLLVIWDVNVWLAFGAVILFPSFVYVLTRKVIVRSLRTVKRDILKKKLQTILLAMLLILMVMWKFNYEVIVLWMLFLSFLFYGWESRIIAALAFLALISCPFLLIYKKDALAETMAIYAYYFLVMTVVLQIAEMRKEDKSLKSESPSGL